ncbi:hypothetical protein [Maritalea mediterranea]|uniref:DUF3955 domain-containing protein n=1 Tax=Maritalea mediterranea TaxID=2909667 RepID=A0ABS9E4L0_9HYPH|nr:hypothetical protein [Maritalea mediterranea]MCF4097132.1 hypothetical protein [Maritalea mediterranea]
MHITLLSPSKMANVIAVKRAGASFGSPRGQARAAAESEQLLLCRVGPERQRSRKMASKFIILGLIALVFAGASLMVETFVFDGGITPDRIVQDTFFLPLSFIFLLIAGAFLIIGSMIKVAKSSD